MISSLLSYLFFGLVGAIVLTAPPLRGSVGRLEQVALAFLVGIGVVVVQLVVYGLVGLPWHVAPILIPWLVWVAVLALRHRAMLVKRARARWRGRHQVGEKWRTVVEHVRRSTRGFELVLWSALAIAVLLAFAASATHLLGVIRGEDAFQQYFLKAKLLFVYGNLRTVLTYHDLWWLANLDHPPLIPFATLWIYTATGGIHEAAALYLTPLIYTCLLVIFYAQVRPHASRILTLGLTVLLAVAPTSPNQLLMGTFSPGYADMPLAVYMFCGASYLYRPLLQRHQPPSRRLGLFLIAGLILGCATLAKNEGDAFLALTIFAGIVVALNTFREDRLAIGGTVAAAVVGSAVAIPWFVARWEYGVSVALLTPAKSGRGIGDLMYVITSMVIHAGGYWNVALVALAAGILLEWRGGPWRATTTFLLAILLGQLAFDVASILIQPLDVHEEVLSTIGRLLLQVTPLVYFLAHVVFANDATLARLQRVLEGLVRVSQPTMTPAQDVLIRQPTLMPLSVTDASSETADGDDAELPVASVVIPTYRRRESLLRVLHALAQQTAPPGSFEVLVICDGDMDGSVAASQALAPTLPYHLRVFEQFNQGPAVARNTGVAAARAALIIFLDDDVVPDPGLLAAHLAAQQGQGHLVAIGPLLPPPDFRLNAWGKWEERSLCRRYDAMAAGKWRATYRQFHTGHASVLRQHVLAAGCFDRRFQRAEDIELAPRLRELGLQFTFLPDARGWHYVKRSFRSWEQMAAAYGHADVAKAQAGWPEELVIAVEHYRGRRSRPVQALAAFCSGRPGVVRVLVSGLGAIATVADWLRVRWLTNAACSAELGKLLRGQRTQEVTRAVLLRQAPAQMAKARHI